MLRTASQEAIWLWRLMGDIVGDVKDKSIDLSSPTLIHSDNQGAIDLVGNESMNNINKHLDIAYHSVWDG